MILVFPPAVRERLESIEREEGIPALETVHQAVEVWSHLTSEDERKIVGIAVMQIVAGRVRA